MEITEIFAKASKEKLRFSFKGNITTEDLWDLSLSNLKLIYTDLKNDLSKISTEDDLFEDINVDIKTKKKIEEYNLAMDIVKYIVQYKKEEAESKKKAAENAALKKKLVNILADKQEESLKNLSEEELIKRINEL